MTKASIAVPAVRNDIADEVRSRVQHGMKQVTVAQLGELVGKLGYRFAKGMSCKSIARIMTGERAGATYPCCNMYPVQQDDGKSFAHFESRRDANFQSLQKLRDTYFAVHGGYIYGW